MKQTSINAYNDLLASGAINNQHHTILSEMSMYYVPKEFTRRQIEEATGFRANVVSGRVNELIPSRIKVVGTMERPVSGRMVEALSIV